MTQHNFKDITNQKFGKLTAIEHKGWNKQGRAIWLCECLCGNYTEVDGADLRSGNTKSCGCSRTTGKNIKFEKFGKLTALYVVGKKRGYNVWRCRCSCGKTKDVPITMLTTGNTKSCGCLHKYSKGIAVRNRHFANYKYRAKIANIPFKLTFEKFLDITSGDCHYCGKPPSYLPKKQDKKYTAKANGIDRKNPKLGYTPRNSVACCKDCNVMKMSLGYSQFKKKIKAIQVHLGI